jgi:proline dehydrogenase
MSMHFDNTEIAFRMKSDRELAKAFLLFTVIGKPWVVNLGSGMVNVALKIHFPIGWLIKPTVYSHFCGGVTLEDCRPAVERLSAFRVKAILDYSVEGKESEEDYEAALVETLKSIRFASGHPNIPFAVFKPTAFTSHSVLEKASLGETLSPQEEAMAQAFKKRIDTLCKAAYDADLPVLIDAEDTWYQHFIDEVVMEMMAKYNHSKAIVFNTFQMYRIDRIPFLEESYNKAVEGNFFLGAKFVRGAYMEKERERALKMGYASPIHPDKECTDRYYNEALRFSMDRIDRIAIFNGTHNEESSALLTELMEQKKIPRDDPHIWFSQLYGMSDHISFNLAYQGYNVAKYVPYGPVKHVTPYLLRRARENTSVAGQTGRELSLLTRERNRRKNKHHADQ